MNSEIESKNIIIRIHGASMTRLIGLVDPCGAKAFILDSRTSNAAVEK